MSHLEIIDFAEYPAKPNTEEFKPKIKIALTAEEKNKIFRLRYKVLVEDLHEPLISVDHNMRQIKDRLDSSAIHLGAFNDKKAVGASRLNYVDDEIRDELSFLEIERFEDQYCDQIVVASNMVIDEEYRDTGLFDSFLHQMYHLALMRDSKIAVAGIPNYLLSIFSQLGFISYKGKVHHPEQGLITPMYLDLQNEGFMFDIGSPFLKTYRLFKENSQIGFVN